MKLLFRITLLLISFNTIAVQNNPSPEEMESWWYKHNTEEIDFYDPSRIKEIYLTNKEKALLVPVSLKNRGRNGFFQTTLVIPTLKKIVLLEGSIVKFVKEVHDFDNDNTSEIIVKDSASGGGAEKGEKAILHLTEMGEPIFLHRIDFETNEGMYGENNKKYYKKDAIWEFIDLNGDDVKDLKETQITHKGRYKKKPIKTKKITHFIFQNGKYKETKK